MLGLLSHTGSPYHICSNALQAVEFCLLLVTKQHEASVVSQVQHIQGHL